jgi:hypothetical protein
MAPPRNWAEWIGIGLCILVAAFLSVGAPVLFGKDSKMEEALREHSKGPMITDDGRPTLKKL